MADTSPSFSTRHSVLSSSGKDDLYSILGGSNGAENRPLATYPVKQFSRKKEAREWPLRPLWGCSRIHLDTRPLPETSPVFLLLFSTRNGSTMIFFSDFSLDLRGNLRSSLEGKPSCETTVSFRVNLYFYYRDCRFEKYCIGVSILLMDI